MKLERITVGVDNSGAAKCAQVFSAQLAERLHATIEAVHVFTVDPARLPGGFVTLPEAEWSKLRDLCSQRFEADWCEPLAKAGVRFETRLVDGTDIAGELIDVAVRSNCGLIVVGTRRLRRLREMVGGSVSYNLTHKSPIPTLVVPAATTSSPKGGRGPTQR